MTDIEARAIAELGFIVKNGRVQHMTLKPGVVGEPQYVASRVMPAQQHTLILWDAYVKALQQLEADPE